jgi:hypothetical protein
MVMANTGCDLRKCGVPLDEVQMKVTDIKSALTLKAGTPLIAREISAVIFVKLSSERTVGSSPISSQMVKRRGTV